MCMFFSIKEIVESKINIAQRPLYRKSFYHHNISPTLPPPFMKMFPSSLSLTKYWSIWSSVNFTIDLNETYPFKFEWRNKHTFELFWNIILSCSYFWILLLFNLTNCIWRSSSLFTIHYDDMLIILIFTKIIHRCVDLIIPPSIDVDLVDCYLFKMMWMLTPSIYCSSWNKYNVNIYENTYIIRDTQSRPIETHLSFFPTIRRKEKLI